MLTQKSPECNSKYKCESCNYKCSKNSDYNKHLSTDKHNRLISVNVNSHQVSRTFDCACGKVYRQCAGLSRHKRTCKVHNNEPLNNIGQPGLLNSHIQTTKDNLIERLLDELTVERAEKNDMKSMFMLMMEKYQEMQMQNQENTREILKETARGNQDLVNKVIDVIPKMGNTTNHNTTNNTLNFYLTNTCKDAESIHDFTDRYVKRCTDFFIENYRNIANKQICLATNVYNIMFTCLEENPQYMNFIQTTDIKNGVHYVKEKKKDENRQLYGEAEFIKYVDGFEKAGASIGHAINKSFFPLQLEFTRKLEQEIGKPPNEDDYDDEESYEDALDRYKSRKREASSSLQTNVCNTMSLFDSKTRKMDILKRTKRARDDDMKIDND
jgi:hypothetical protein